MKITAERVGKVRVRLDYRPFFGANYHIYAYHATRMDGSIAWCTASFRPLSSKELAAIDRLPPP